MLRMPTVSFLCFVIAVFCLIGPAWVVTGTDVPKGQREAVAQIMGAIFFMGGVIMVRLDAKFRDDEDED